MGPHTNLFTDNGGAHYLFKEIKNNNYINNIFFNKKIMQKL